MTNRLPLNDDQPPTPPAVVPCVVLPVPAIEGGTPLTLQQQMYLIALQQAQAEQAQQLQRTTRYETDWLNSSN